MVFFFNQFDFQIVIREAFYRKKIVVGEASEVFNGIDRSESNKKNKRQK